MAGLPWHRRSAGEFNQRVTTNAAVFQTEVFVGEGPVLHALVIVAPIDWLGHHVVEMNVPVNVRVIVGMINAIHSILYFESIHEEELKVRAQHIVSLPGAQIMRDERMRAVTMH